ncbi:Patatin-like phospholipase [Jannaschia seosinensis]|uniref:Patatin-like phospholipase n=1 Tax=Jannaschia seosinensis TaxID=313367 RepID=A0A0M7B6I9_9RHOB|nr:patatin-like phospholipase family protein [Jannaschia seosinensis]CUH33702.1 Patatin-like phospholipase [Jannaschia seosinensis]
MNPLRILLPCLLLTLSACAVTRPASVACPTFPGADAAVMSTQGPAVPPPADDGMMARTRSEIAGALRAELADAPRGPVTFHVVTLSSGGQYGAFGAGFLTGWSDNAVTPRPVFNLVTGVSAGAILAPVAFAGRRFDRLLADYAGLGADDLLRRRVLPGLLRAPSLASPAPLEAFLANALSPDLVSAVAAGETEGRRLLIGATNIDTGEAEILDLGRAAGTPNAALCLREAMLASAAIPALLPPRNINHALYADGGLREHVFLRALDQAVRDVATASGREIRVEAYLVVNGALLAPEGPATDSMPGYALRSVEILADEVLRDSILEAVSFAETRPDWRLRGIRADLPARTCWIDTDGDSTPDTAPAAEIGGFSPCLTQALFEHGRAVGAATPIPWLGAEDLRALAREL